MHIMQSRRMWSKSKRQSLNILLILHHPKYLSVAGNTRNTDHCDREMADPELSSLWDVVIMQTKEAQEKGSDPLLWSIEVSSNLASAGVSLPSIELADVLVSHICWENNVPIMWKFLEKALVFNMVPSMLVLALLSSRVIPNRRVQPIAYRLYMELLKRHAFSLKSQIKGPSYQQVMISIDTILNLSQTFGLQTTEAGTTVVAFIFSTVWQLLDSSLDDEGLLELAPEKKSIWPTKPQDMDIDGLENHHEERNEQYERLQSRNTVMAIELIAEFLQNLLTSKILNLAKRNMLQHWEAFVKRLQVLAEKSSALKNTKLTSPEELLKLASNICMSSQKSKLRSVHKCHSIMDSSDGICHGTGRSTIWLPLDLVLEDALNATQINATSSIEVITGLMKVLQAINCATWHDTFLGLWIAALRLVQREREPLESPFPHLESRLCMLLSITTLVVAGLIEEDESAKVDTTEYSFANHSRRQKVTGKSRDDLVSSLQMLGNFIGLLAPPRSVVSAANRAAAKAMFFISGTRVESAHLDCISTNDSSTDCSGNMRHLIVEACIARNLIDTSAYFWPGYVKGGINGMPSNIPADKVPGWSSLMQGAELTPLLTKELISIPAPSLTELEKIYEIAINGSDSEKISAVTVLCGASLNQGWNIQEHTAHFIIRLLSPPCPANYSGSGSGSHLIGYAPFLNALVVGISSIDCIKIFSLLGMVPQLACSVMAICETFGSCVPNETWSSTPGTETSAHAVFSNGFTLILKLWRFNHCFSDQLGYVPTVQSNLTPEYFLLVRNSHLVSSEKVRQDPEKRRLAAVSSSSSAQPIFIDSFPKLKAWYMQHNACIASTPPGLTHGNPIHRHVDELLNMMFKDKEQGRDSNASVSGSPSKEADEDTYLRNSAAWDILAAVPFVADAALTACNHGRLTPRKLATGLKVLVDFLPASLGTIVSYLSAEIRRGVWKPAYMNGTDWPCPDANLPNIVEKIKIIVAATSVDVPSTAHSEGNCQATLPLPLAALVSLTITYKTDRDSKRYLDLCTVAMASIAAGCPWPCMPIVFSLWTQKAKRWGNHFVFSASRAVFLQHPNALIQVLKSCFTATLGLQSSPLSYNGGIGALLAHGIGSHIHGRVSPVAPGILYLHVYPYLSDIVFLNKEIVSLMMYSVSEITGGQVPTERCKRLKAAKNAMIKGQYHMASNLTRGKLMASLAASLVWLSGGLDLVQSLFKEFLPSWFVSIHSFRQDGESNGDAWLRGYVLAYFASLCGGFVWGIDSSSWGSKRRPKILGTHMEFLASALDGQISLGCDQITWRAYVLGFMSLMVVCMPTWMLDVDVDALKRISKRLRQWNEEELALDLLGIGGVDFMGAAAEMIIESEP